MFKNTLKTMSERMFVTNVFAGLLSVGLILQPALAAQNVPAQSFSTDSNTGWVPDRRTGDDFLPPPSGPGPVASEKGHPYIPNGQGQPTYRIADLSNPILKPWVVDQLAKGNDRVSSGKVPFSPRERCWPAGVPDFDIYTRVAPIYFLETPKEVTIVIELDHQVRHVYLNVPHSEHVTPSWYGESVGHYEGDELIVDTIGLSDKTFVDNYNTPHTDQLHVVERFRLVDSGKTLQVDVTVDDPGAFNMPWSATQRWRRGEARAMTELNCAENNFGFLGYDVAPIPEARKPDF
jgi:hypothetical protein